MNSVAFLKDTNLVLIEARRAARALRQDKPSRRRMLKLCQSLLADRAPEPPLAALWSLLAPLQVDERYYWIGTFYTLLLPPNERSAQAAYFTPPHLARGFVEMAERQGFNPKVHTAIDPAAGGASFLSTIAGTMLAAGLDQAAILERLRGYEIDEALAALSESLLAHRLRCRVSRGTVVAVKDSLRARPQTRYDLVIANPPYGRISPSELADEKWRLVCHPGHINKYALFAELCFRLAKDDGLIALVLPSSFVAGPLYGRLRSFIRTNGEILAVSSVERRADVFVDVAQDISVLMIRKAAGHRAGSKVTFGSYGRSFKVGSVSSLPTDIEGPWISSGAATSLAVGGATLADYGATLRSGYFVWNREKARMLQRAQGDFDVPLIWAKNIRAGGFCQPAARKREGIDFVRFAADSPAIIREQALVMQRTTNSAQPRRLIVSRVSPSVLEEWGGFVSENHTITVTGPDIATLNALRLLLNSAAVDARYRLLSGTASVSVNLLRKLDLPKPHVLLDAIQEHGVCERAVEEAYRRSAVALAEVGT